jgi:RNA polymerase sigma-70 factor (ECF subfamily)
MDDQDWLAERFEANRVRLRAVAYKMLGSLSEADDAVQESWLHLSRSGGGVDNLDGWLTTVVARVCLDMLRSRRSRREKPVGARLPDPIVSREEAVDPEQEALLADSVGLALLVLLDTLSPGERLAFVLHDLFAVPFEQIAPIVGRSPAAARQLASRARRRVQGARPVPDADLGRQRRVVDAFFAAARDGDFEALVAVLDPEVVIRADSSAELAPSSTRGAAAAARRALTFAHLAPFAQPVLVNGAVGAVIVSDERPFSVLAFTVRGDRITEIDILADPVRLRELALDFLDD